MPCYYTGSSDGDRAFFAKQTAEKQEKLLTEVTQVACEALAALEAAGLSRFLSSKTKAWWENHKKVDAKRKGQG